MKVITNSIPKRNMLYRWKLFDSDNRILLFMILPCIAFIILFSYVPLFGWIYGFFDYKPGIPLSRTPFVGLKFIRLALADPELLNVLINTLAMSFLAILTMPLSAIFAIMLSEIKATRYSKLVQVTTTLPNFMSWIIIFSIFFLFLSTDDGVLNNVLMKLHLIQQPTNILGNVDDVWLFQTAIKVWKEMGYGAIIYLAAIAGIDPELYDAASVDGAGRMRKIVHITIPQIMPTFIVLLLLSIGFMLSNGIDQYFVFYNPLVHDKIQVLDYYVYRIGIVNHDYAFSTALSMFKTIISIIILFTVNRIAKVIRGESII